MAETQIWLTEQAHELLKQELTGLLRQRARQSAPVLAVAEVDDGHRESAIDHDVLHSDHQRNRRIRQIQETLLHSVVGREMADDGIAEPGMLLTVRYGSDQQDEIFLLAHRVGAAHADVETCSPDSPLGQALCGAREGERREYRLPDERIGTVRLVRAIPYRRPSGPR